MLAALFFVLGSSPSGLAQYADKDLSKLSYTEVGEFNSILNGLTRDSLNDFEGYGVPKPEWVREHKSGRMQWLVVLVYRSYDTPGICFLRAYGFDSDWKHLWTDDALMGYRLYIFDSRIEQVDAFELPLFKFRLDWSGSSAQSTYGNAKWSTDEWFAFDQNGVHLVRIADGEGELQPGHFAWAVPSIGQNTMGRTAAEWKAALSSKDPLKQMDCLQWLSGKHLKSSEPREEGTSQESVEDSKTYEALRDDLEVARLLSKLKLSPNAWVQKQAAFAISQLSISSRDSTR